MLKYRILNDCSLAYSRLLDDASATPEQLLMAQAMYQLAVANLTL